MKQMLLIMHLLCCMGVVNAQDGSSGPPRKSMKMDPVAVSQNGNVITVYFYQYSGNVTVSALDTQGRMIYQVQTNSTSPLAVDTRAWPDTFMVSVRNQDGILKEILLYRDE